MRRTLSLILIAIFVVLLGHREQADAMVLAPQREYRYYGNLTLAYDRAWSSNRDAFEHTTYSLNLGLNGFIIDPRLMIFDVSGIFSQTFATDTDTSTVDGISLKLRFLQERPRAGTLRYFPQPIELRYSYFSYENSTYTNYGLSMAYLLSDIKEWNTPAIPAANNNQNSGQNIGQNAGQRGFKQTWYSVLTRPDIYFDFDRSDFTNELRTSTYDRLDLRAEARSTHVDYFAEYRYEKSNLDMVEKTHLLEFQANIHRYWKETASRLESYNTLFFEKRGSEKTVSFLDHTSFIKNMGPELRDSIVINGGGNYFSREDNTEYGLSLDASYNKFFSPRFSNSAIGILSYVDAEAERFHSETVKDLFQYNVSNYLSVIGQGTAGLTDRGSLYGISIAAPLRLRFSIMPGFDLFATDYEDEKQTTGTLSLSLSGPLFRNMSFSSQNYYRISDIDNGTSSSRDKTLSLTANVLWLISRFNVSVGATYLDTTTGERFGTGLVHQPETKRTYTTIYANASSYLTRRLLFNMLAYYQKEKNGPATTSITPILTWQWRRVTLTARYTLNIRENSENDHRIFLRFTRQLGGSIRPFL